MYIVLLCFSFYIFYSLVKIIKYIYYFYKIMIIIQNITTLNLIFYNTLYININQPVFYIESDFFKQKCLYLFKKIIIFLMYIILFVNTYHFYYRYKYLFILIY